MKQSETLTKRIGDGAANLFECSNTPTHKIPRLTILMPWRQGRPDEKDDPPQSLCLGSEATHDLYQMLREYYEASNAPHEPPPPSDSREPKTL